MMLAIGSHAFPDGAVAALAKGHHWLASILATHSHTLMHIKKPGICAGMSVTIRFVTTSGHWHAVLVPAGIHMARS